jgi:uncharacterized protein
MNISPFIFQLVGKSPLHELQGHMALVIESVDLLSSFFDHALAGDWSAASEVLARIVEKEHAADEKKRAIRVSLHKHWFTTLPRRDMLALVKLQDSIANEAKDISGILYGRKMMIPEALHKGLKAYVGNAISVCYKAQTLVSDLSKLIETGFSKDVAQIIERTIKELSDMEHLTDEEQITVRDWLHDQEQDMNPVDVVFLYDVIKRIGSLADRSETLAERMLLLLGQ